MEERGGGGVVNFATLPSGKGGIAFFSCRLHFFFAKQGEYIAVFGIQLLL